jgi:hypothetical protein
MNLILEKSYVVISFGPLMTIYLPLPELSRDNIISQDLKDFDVPCSIGGG